MLTHLILTLGFVSNALAEFSLQDSKQTMSSEAIQQELVRKEAFMLTDINGVLSEVSSSL